MLKNKITASVTKDVVRTLAGNVLRQFIGLFSILKMCSSNAADLPKFRNTNDFVRLVTETGKT